HEHPSPPRYDDVNRDRQGSSGPTLARSHEPLEHEPPTKCSGHLLACSAPHRFLLGRRYPDRPPAGVPARRAEGAEIADPRKSENRETRLADEEPSRQIEDVGLDARVKINADWGAIGVARRASRRVAR